MNKTANCDVYFWTKKVNPQCCVDCDATVFPQAKHFKLKCSQLKVLGTRCKLQFYSWEMRNKPRIGNFNPWENDRQSRKLSAMGNERQSRKH